MERAPRHTKKLQLLTRFVNEDKCFGSAQAEVCAGRLRNLQPVTSVTGRKRRQLNCTHNLRSRPPATSWEKQAEKHLYTPAWVIAKN